jgi:hypothetical protein
MIVAASMQPLLVRDGRTIKTLSAGLTVFRIGGDGNLAFARKYEIDVSSKTQLWSGMVTLSSLRRRYKHDFKPVSFAGIRGVRVEVPLQESRHEAHGCVPVQRNILTTSVAAFRKIASGLRRADRRVA